MSRIGKREINLPAGVTVVIDGALVSVKGPLGELSHTLPKGVSAILEANVLKIVIAQDTRQLRSLHGLSRTLVDNMVIGVSAGFTKDLELIGVGYKAATTPTLLTLALGYSHPVEIPIPKGVGVTVEANTKIAIKGIDKQELGDLAAFIRSKRPPEPYKGKGVRYKGEVILRKAGKAGKK
jgi:large subunit ribosomal protein L6